MAALLAAVVLGMSPWAVYGEGASPSELFVDADDPNCTDVPAEKAGASASPFCSIQSAIDFLEAETSTGGQLTLRAAEYAEGTVTIDHGDLIIRGDPAVLRSAVVVHPDGPGDIGFHISDPLEVCDNVTIEHLTLDGLSPESTAQGIVVEDVCDGHTFSDLEVKNWGGEGILLQGSSSDEADNGSDDVMIVDSSVLDNGDTGVELSHGSDNTIVDTDIFGNGGSGVLATGQRDLRVEGADISDNGLHGIRDIEGVSNAINNSAIAGNEGDGVFATGPHTGLKLTNSDISGNEGTGVRFTLDVFGEGGSDTIIMDNEINENEAGVVSRQHEHLEIRGNVIIGSADAGVRLTGDFDVAVASNEISEGLGSGIVADNVEALSITDNMVADHGEDGVVLNRGEATVAENALTGNSGSGLSARNLFSPTFMDNAILASGGVGVDLQGNQEARLHSNRVSNGASDGIVARDESQLVISGNEVRDNTRSGIRIVNGSNNEVVANHDIADNGSSGSPSDYGILALETSHLTIAKNVVNRNLDGQVVVDASDQVVIEKNDLLTAVDGIILRASSSHAFGVVIGGSRDDYNRFRGLTPATNECDSPDDACYVGVEHTILPGDEINAQHNDWGTVSTGEIENVVCHDGEGDVTEGYCGLNVVDFGSPRSPVGDSPADKTPTPPDSLLGDVDCDGEVRAIDAALILQLIAGLIESLGCEQNADVDLDGAVNPVDAALVLQYVAELLPSLPP